MTSGFGALIASTDETAHHAMWWAVSLRERSVGVDHSGIQIGPSQKPQALWPLSQTGFTHWPL